MANSLSPALPSQASYFRDRGMAGRLGYQANLDVNSTCPDLGQRTAEDVGWVSHGLF